MNYAACLKEIGRGQTASRPLKRGRCTAIVMGAMLEGGVPDLEFGALPDRLAHEGRVPG